MSQKRAYREAVHIANDVYIKPTYIIIKPQFTQYGRSRTIKQIDNEKNLQKNKHKNELSKKAISNLRNSVNWLVHSAKYKRVWVRSINKSFWFKVNFITLTIPPQKQEVISEKQFKECLNIWLTYARKYFYLVNYVWKIEAHADKRLHIHFTTDTFINYKSLRDSWNRVLQSKGLLDEHFIKFQNYNPNSTDVHATNKVNRLAAYLCEYLIKKPNLPDNYKGRIWSSSYSLSAKNKCHVELEPVYSRENYGWQHNKEIQYKKIETKPDAMGTTKSVGDMYFMDEVIWDKYMCGLIKEAYNNHRKQIRDNTISSPQSYRTIDFFAHKKVSEYKAPMEKNINFDSCEIKNSIRKTGPIQLDLQF